MSDEVFGWLMCGFALGFALLSTIPLRKWRECQRELDITKEQLENYRKSLEQATKERLDAINRYDRMYVLHRRVKDTIMEII